MPPETVKTRPEYQNRISITGEKQGFLKRSVQVATLLMWLLSSFNAFAQAQNGTADSTVAKGGEKDHVQETDMIDLLMKLLKNEKPREADTSREGASKIHLSVAPAAGYTLQTSLAGVVVANAAFSTGPDANTSSLQTSFTYTVRNQIILPLQSNIWTKGNKWNFVTDWRYLKFPTYTYGIGGYTAFADGYLIDYSALRFRQTVFRELATSFYAGIGYNLDYYWNIQELNPPAGVVTDFQKYGLQNTELTSGVTFNFLYDSRKNSINPDNGGFVNVIYRPNLKILGNSTTWRSLMVDLRKYFHFPEGSKNILAFWNYDWLTLSGDPPYLMMPNTGGDPYSNTGRGYVQGRFRGKNMVYAEGEYRFGITANGLLGAVIFANAESFTELSSGKFEVIAPGWGAGLRLKLNKFSKASVAIDYGFGLNGSGGLFVNLGEVF